MSKPGANRRGILAICTATSVFTFNDALAKVVIRTLPLGEMIFLRGIVTILCLLIALIALGQFRQLPRLLSWRIVLRSFLDACATVLFVVALIRVHLADLVSITLTSPLMLTAMCVFIFKEKVGWRRWSAIVVGLIGTLFIVKPTPGAFDVWALMGLVVAFASATRDLITQRLHPRIPVLCVSLAACTAVTLSGLAIGVTETWRVPTVNEATLLACAAALYSVGGYMIVVSFRGVEISVVAPFRYTLLLWGILSGYLVLGEVPDRWSFIGGALVVGSGIYMLHREHVRHRDLTGKISPQ